MEKHTDALKIQLAPILEVAAGYSKEMGINVLALVGKGECYKPGGEAVAVVAIHSKASAKDQAYADRLALRYNSHDALVAALEAEEEARHYESELVNQADNMFIAEVAETKRRIADDLRRAALSLAKGTEVGE